MSQRNAFTYIRSLGVEKGMEALNGPVSLPFTVDVLASADVPKDVYEAFGGLHTLTRGHHDAERAYRLLGRSVFPKAENGEGQPFDVTGEEASSALLQQYHQAGKLVIFLSNNDLRVVHGIRPGLGRNRWDVGGPFQVSVAEDTNFDTIVTQSISRSEPTEEVLPYSPQNQFHGITFPG